MVRNKLISLTETIKDARSSQPIRVPSENSSKAKEVQSNYVGYFSTYQGKFYFRNSHPLITLWNFMLAFFVQLCKTILPCMQFVIPDRLNLGVHLLMSSENAYPNVQQWCRSDYAKLLTKFVRTTNN